MELDKLATFGFFFPQILPNPLKGQLAIFIIVQYEVLQGLVS